MTRESLISGILGPMATRDYLDFCTPQTDPHYCPKNENNTPFTGLKTSRNFYPDYGEHVKGGKLGTLWTLGILPLGMATNLTSAMTYILE